MRRNPLSAEMQRLTAVLDQENKDITRAQSALSAASAHANAGFTNHTIRGELLDTLAKMMSQRNQLEQQLEDDANLMQAIKDEIADLLNKLANCAPPSTTQSPGPEPQNQQPTPPSKPSPSASQTSMSTTGAGIQFQLRGFGGASFINGNTPGTSGFDGAVLFPLGNRILVGPTAGFQWINSSIVNSIGSQQPGSTFIDTSAGFKEGRFGGRIGFPFGGWQLGVQGGATVAGSTITQATGFCGTGGPTAPAGCHVLSSTTTHDTLTGSFVGGYISHSIFSHVGIFVGYDYFRPAEFKSSATVLDLHYSDAVAGLNFTFGRH